MFNFLKKKSPVAGQSITLKIDGMHCMSCSMNIDDELEDTPGVIEADTNYAKGEAKVNFDPAKTNLGQLKKAVESLGYTVKN
jgi:Cu+-exporting ATPase